MKFPGSVGFDIEELDRIDYASLVLLGIQPSEVEKMSYQQKYDVLSIAEAQIALRNGKMPGEQ